MDRRHRKSRQRWIAAPVVVIATTVATACGASRSAGSSPSSAVTPAAMPATPSAQASMGGTGNAFAGDNATGAGSLWGMSQAACPQAPAGGALGDTAPGGTAPGGTAGAAGSQPGAARSVPDTASRRPAIILRASASAQEVRFDKQPQIVVRLCGGTLDSVRVIERRNLPSPVVAGTTYRDVYIAVEILGHLDAACIASKVGADGANNAAANCASLALSDSAGARRVPAATPTRP